MNVHEFVASYQFDASDDGIFHTPDDAEKAMLEDAITAYLSTAPSGQAPLEGVKPLAFADPAAIRALKGTPATAIYLSKEGSAAYSMALYAIADERWKAQAQQATSVISMIRAMIGEMFGPIANIESEEATLLRGPEAKHDGEAILEALQRVASVLLPASAEPVDPLDILAKNVGWELSWGDRDNDLSEVCWRVHRASGGRNDREWTLIGTGETPRAALKSAIVASGISVPPASGAVEAGWQLVPTYECQFYIGQPVRLARPCAEENPDTIYYVTGINWEHRLVPNHGWDITIATAEDIAKRYGQTDGYAPSDLLPAAPTEGR